jgi:hypothetical protein
MVDQAVPQTDFDAQTRCRRGGRHAAVVDDRERVLATGRFGTDKTGYAAMR